MGGVDLERHLGVGLTPPTPNHQEKPPDTQSTSGGVGGGRGQPRPLSRLVRVKKSKKLRKSDLSRRVGGVASEQVAPTELIQKSAVCYKQVAPTGLEKPDSE